MTWIVDKWNAIVNGEKRAIGQKKISADRLCIDHGCLIFCDDQFVIIKAYNAGEWLSVELLEG